MSGQNASVQPFQTFEELQFYFHSLEFRARIAFEERMREIERDYHRALLQFREQERQDDTLPGDGEQEREP